MQSHMDGQAAILLKDKESEMLGAGKAVVTCTCVIVAEAYTLVKRSHCFRSPR